MNSETVSLHLRGVVLLRQPLEPACAEPALRELTAAIRRGDEQAFTRFHDLYSLRLYKYLLVLAKGKDGEAREVLQTVVLKLARKMEIFEEERRLWAWMCRLARNAFVDRCRSRRRDHVLVSLEELPLELVETARNEGHELKGAEDRLSICLAQALESFTSDESELLRAAYIDDRPLQDLADEAGQTYKALESRLGRLRKKLKQTLLNRLSHEEEF